MASNPRMNPIYWLARTTARLLARVLFGWRVEGETNLPETGGFILAANHVSYADPPLIGAASPRMLRYMAKRELFRPPLFRQLISALGAFPVNRVGLDRQALRLATDFLAAGYGILIFPAGTRTRGESPARGRPGISLLAAESATPVVPARIEGSAHLRDAFLRRRPLRIRFGAPLAPPPGGEGTEHREILRSYTADLMAAIEELAGADTGNHHGG
jgi:1-acyl-sn-glycerol-3-phosphate acyltransferase